MSKNTRGHSMTYTLFGTKYRVFLERKTYANNNRTSLQLVDEADGFPFSTCTVNVPDVEMEQNEVAIKNYSENEGMVEFLVANDIVEEPHRFIQSGFVTIPICRLK